MELLGTDDSDASKPLAWPASPGVTLKAAVGAWSGVMASASGQGALRLILVRSAWSASRIGWTQQRPVGTYAVPPSGVMAMAIGLVPTEMLPSDWGGCFVMSMAIRLVSPGSAT